jgi:hypothetical protein
MTIAAIAAGRAVGSLFTIGMDVLVVSDRCARARSYREQCAIVAKINARVRFDHRMVGCHYARARSHA